MINMCVCFQFQSFRVQSSVVVSVLASFLFPPPRTGGAPEHPITCLPQKTVRYGRVARYILGDWGIGGFGDQKTVPEPKQTAMSVERVSLADLILLVIWFQRYFRSERPMCNLLNRPRVYPLGLQPVDDGTDITDNAPPLLGSSY